jgi:hypothetical protein
MAFGLRFKVDYGWIPDGAGAMEVASSAFLRFEPSGNSPAGVTLGSGDGAQWEPVPGGNAPTQANLITGLNNMVTDITAQLTPAVVARIQGFATGGG